MSRAKDKVWPFRMEGLTGTREEIIADQITNAMKVTGITTTKTATAARMRIRCSAALKNSVASS
jgi:hypothetical protein